MAVNQGKHSSLYEARISTVPLLFEVDLRFTYGQTDSHPDVAGGGDGRWCKSRFYSAPHYQGLLETLGEDM